MRTIVVYCDLAQPKGFLVFLHSFNHFLPFYSPILDDVEPEGNATILVG